MSTDYYRTLGIERGAPASEIQRAYRDLARKFHPDMNPDDKSAKEKFQAVQKAYEVLSDPEKRQMYDRFGSDFENAAGGPQGWQTRHQGGETIDLSDILGGGAGGGGFSDFFRQFTGGAGRSAGPRAATRNRRGADIEHALEVPFRSAIVGGQAQVTVRRSGGKTETLNVKIPVGIEDGKKIRLRGQGEPSPTGGESGDILITVRVSAHPYYSRSNNDLIVKVPVSLAEAALGGSVDVPTPKGTIALKIPEGTSSGKRLRIKGHGVETKEKTGDLLAEIEIVLPANLDDESKDLIRRFKERNSDERLREDLIW